MRAWWLVIATACGSSAPAPAPPANHPPPGTPSAPAANALLAWPVAPFTPAQIAEVKACDVGKLAESRYPKAIGVGELPAAFAPKTTCDQAVLAVACATRFGDDKPPPPCLDAYRAAVKANPAFAVG